MAFEQLFFLIHPIRYTSLSNLSMFDSLIAYGWVIRVFYPIMDFHNSRLTTLHFAFSTLMNVSTTFLTPCSTLILVLGTNRLFFIRRAYLMTQSVFVLVVIVYLRLYVFVNNNYSYELFARKNVGNNRNKIYGGS